MIKTKKLMALCLTALTFATVAVPAATLTTTKTVNAQTYHKGALLTFKLKKVATNGGWYTEDNFEKHLKRTFNGYTYSYTLTNVSYETKGKNHITYAYYSID